MLHALDKGNPLAVAYPIEGTLLIVDASAVMANAPHPNATRLFMEFLQSEEVPKISVE